MPTSIAAATASVNGVKNATVTGSNTASIVGQAMLDSMVAVNGELQAEQSADFTAVKGGIYPVNCSLSAITVTPPASPVLDDWFAINDSRGSAATNNIVVDFTTAGQNLHGSIQNYVSNANRDSRVLRYSGATLGWVCE